MSPYLVGRLEDVTGTPSVGLYVTALVMALGAFAVLTRSRDAGQVATGASREPRTT